MFVILKSLPDEFIRVTTESMLFFSQEREHSAVGEREPAGNDAISYGI